MLLGEVKGWNASGQANRHRRQCYWPLMNLLTDCPRRFKQPLEKEEVGEVGEVGEVEDVEEEEEATPLGRFHLIFW